MTIPDLHKTQNDPADAGAVRTAWEVPETVEVDLGQAETANTNSNFDGTSASS